MSTAYKDFASTIAEEVSGYIEETETKIDLHTAPLSFIDEERGRINSLLAESFDSNQKLKEVFFNYYNETRANKNISLVDLCESYCRDNKIFYTDEGNYFLRIFSLHKERDWLIEIYESISVKDAVRMHESEELKEGEFTLTRRTLAFLILMQVAERDTDFPQNANRMNISKVVDFFTSKEMKPKRDMRDTAIYKTVRTYLFNEKNAALEDLVYLRDLFGYVGSKNVVDYINEIIIEKEKKNV